MGCLTITMLKIEILLRDANSTKSIVIFPALTVQLLWVEEFTWVDSRLINQKPYRRIIRAEEMVPPRLRDPNVNYEPYYPDQERKQWTMKGSRWPQSEPYTSLLGFFMLFLSQYKILLNKNLFLCSLVLLKIKTSIKKTKIDLKQCKKLE